MKQAAVDLSIILPAYHEADRIGETLKAIAEFIKTRDYGIIEIVVVAQDNETAEAAKSQSKLFTHCNIIDLGTRAGKGGAVRIGMSSALGRYKLFMDADLATPLVHLDEVKRLIDKKVRVAIGVRDITATHKGLRKFISEFGNLLVQVLLLPGIKDTQCGFKLFESKVASELFERQIITSWGFDMEVLALARQLGYKIELIEANDWKDPKMVGLVGDSSLKVAISTFTDLLKIRLNLLTGKYKLPGVYKISNGVWLSLFILIGGAVRFFGATRSSIWHDEGYTMMLAPDQPLLILARTARDVHPPLYYLVLHYWIAVFGNSELSARALSICFMLATIAVVFYLIKRLFGDSAARLSAVFLALAPFLVRYSQEARMYAMVAFLLALATLFLVRAVQDKRDRDWFWYGLLMAAALYTHYYAIFMIAVHWVYVLSLTKHHAIGEGLRDLRWWGSNTLAFLLFAPWLPVAYAQFSRVQASFWIPPVTLSTVPSTLAQFLTFTNLDSYPLFARLAFTGLFAVAALGLLWSNRSKLSSVVLMLSYMALAPLAVLVLSVKRPIYVDRYFVFAAVAFYAVLAIMHYHAWPWKAYRAIRISSVLVVLGLFGYGIHNVYSQNYHQMKDTGNTVSLLYQPGDEIVSGELYTYFDFSYYNRTNAPLKLLAPGGVGGYGESSLFYERADQIVVNDLSQLKPSSGYVWVIGKSGPHDYFDAVPSNWSRVGPHYVAGYTAAQKYFVRVE